MPPRAPSPDPRAQGTVYLGLGSNVGDRRGHLERAAAGLARLGELRLSRVYETAPVGPRGQGPFLNQAAELVTAWSPSALHAEARAIEAAAGREPVDQRKRWGPRVLDIDLLLYDDRVCDAPGLTLPHPRMHERRFVLQPLCELAPAAVHPTLHRTMRELLDDLDDDP